jgi:hypothetical protein
MLLKDKICPMAVFDVLRKMNPVRQIEAAELLINAYIFFGQLAACHQVAPEYQSDSALACSSAPHPSDPQPPNPVTKGSKTDIPTLLSADILALRPQRSF